MPQRKTRNSVASNDARTRLADTANPHVHTAGGAARQQNALKNGRHARETIQQPCQVHALFRQTRVLIEEIE